MISKNQKIYTHPKTGRMVVETLNDEKTMAPGEPYQRTQQQFKDECDINNIMKKYATTGEFTHLSKRVGQSLDLSNITDYHSMLNQVIEAETAFNGLPADIRKKFNNDPGQLIHFLQDNKNYDEGVKLGLVNPKPTQPTQSEPPPNQNPKPKPKAPIQPTQPTDSDLS